MENPKKFSIYFALPEIIKIYNNKVYSSTKCKPSVLIKCRDENIIKEVIKNIKSSQSKYKNTINSIKDNTPCLLWENYELNGDIIKSKYSIRRANMLYLVL